MTTQGIGSFSGFNWNYEQCTLATPVYILSSYLAPRQIITKLKFDSIAFTELQQSSEVVFSYQSFSNSRNTSLQKKKTLTISIASVYKILHAKHS